MEQPAQAESGPESLEEFAAATQRMGDRNRQRIDRARAKGRARVLQQEFRCRNWPDGPMLPTTYVESMARIEERERLARGEGDPADNGRAWQQKFIADDGAVFYDDDAIRASNTHWKAREARCRRPAPSRLRSRQSRGHTTRTRGSRRSAPSGGGGDPGDDSGESDPDDDDDPLGVGETAERRCVCCGRPCRSTERTCARCRQRRSRARRGKAKQQSPLVSPEEIDAEQHHDQLVWLMEAAADGLPYLTGPGRCGMAIA